MKSNDPNLFIKEIERLRQEKNILGNELENTKNSLLIQQQINTQYKQEKDFEVEKQKAENKLLRNKIEELCKLIDIKNMPKDVNIMAESSLTQTYKFPKTMPVIQKPNLLEDKLMEESPYNINDDDFTLARKRIERLDITAYEMIEYVAYAAVGDVYTAYVFLYSNKQLLSSVVEYMIEERYVSELKEALDSFSGIIDNNDIDDKKRFAYYDAYNNLDEAFAEIKRNNKDYIK